MMHRILILCVSIIYSVFCQTNDILTFVVAGDSRGSDNGINRMVLSELRDAVLKEKAELVIFPGDLVTGPKDYATMMAYFSNWASEFMLPLKNAGIPVYAVRGNHDLVSSGSNAAAWNDTFSGDFAMPQNGPEKERNLTYAVSRKNALFIGLDVYITGRTGIADVAWMQSVLATNTLPHVFAFTHVPLYPLSGKGAHADGYAYSKDIKGARVPERDAFVYALSAAGSYAYFCGHDHWFDAGSITLTNGREFYQMLSGGAGAPIRKWEGSNYAEPAMKNITHFDDFGYLVVVITGDDVAMTAKRRSAANTFDEIATVRYTAAKK
ncbi:MAG: metallophosphatase family protein [Spirochaetes bacterium]|nr:metallophosphatase family protein [Spirochaetota bacterium]